MKLGPLSKLKKSIAKTSKMFNYNFMLVNYDVIVFPDLRSIWSNAEAVFGMHDP